MQVPHEGDDRGRAKQAAFRSILAAAPKHVSSPVQGKPCSTHCKPAQVDAQQGKDPIPSEVQANGEPQVTRAEEGVAEENAPQRRVQEWDEPEVEIEGVSECEEHAERKDGGPRADASYENLES